MAVLTYAHVLNAVIYADDDVVPFSRLDVVGQVVAVRCRERQVVTCRMAVDEDGGLNVGTFQEQEDGLVCPFRWHVDALAIPRCADVVLLRRQEERKLDVSLHPVFLHVGVEVERRVVQRARPLRLHVHRVALVVGQHRAGQHDIILIVGCFADGKFPFTR